MKRATEAEFGAALRSIDGLNLYVYRPPDPKSGEGVSNWKPADFMVWAWLTEFVNSAWFEVKDVAAVDRFAYSELRTSQIAGIHEAARVGIPYWLAVWWRRHRVWTISDAAKVLDWRLDSISKELTGVTSIPRTLLVSRFGIEATRQQLASTLKAVLLGEVDNG